MLKMLFILKSKCCVEWEGGGGTTIWFFTNHFSLFSFSDWNLGRFSRSKCCVEGGGGWNDFSKLNQTYFPFSYSDWNLGDFRSQQMLRRGGEGRQFDFLNQNILKQFSTVVKSTPHAHKFSGVFGRSRGEASPKKQSNFASDTPSRTRNPSLK